MPTALYAEILAAAGTIIVARRPEPIILAAGLIIPLRSGSASTIVLLSACIIISACIQGPASGQRHYRLSFPVASIAMLALWITSSYILQVRPEFQPPTLSDLLQPLAGILIAGVASVFPPRRDDFAIVGLAATIVFSLVAFQAQTDIDGRINAMGLNANYLGALLALSLASSLALRGKILLATLPLSLTICVVAMARTQSRGALLILVIALFLRFGLLRPSGAPRKPSETVAVTAAIIGTLVMLVPAQYDSLESNYFSSRRVGDFAAIDRERQLGLETSMRLAIQNPVFGVGYGNLPAISAGTPGVHQFLNSHNEYARLAAELGLPGLILYLVPLGVATRACARHNRLMLPIVGAFLALGTLGNFFGSVATACFFWIALGIALGPVELLVGGRDQKHPIPTSSRGATVP